MKKALVVLAALALVAGFAGQGHAKFADNELIRVIVDPTTNKEAAYDLGTIANVEAGTINAAVMVGEMTAMFCASSSMKFKQFGFRRDLAFMGLHSWLGITATGPGRFVSWDVYVRKDVAGRRPSAWRAAEIW